MSQPHPTPRTLSLGFLGPAGTFSEEAARAYAAASPDQITIIPGRDIPEILTAVAAGRYDLGIVPAENSIEGSVAITLDMLAHEVDLTIQREVVIAVRHNLLVPPGTAVADVRTVVSHPQALAQCRRNLKRLLPAAETVAASSTADAARLVAAGGAGMAAIGTLLAAELYDLAVAARDLQDEAENATRFFVVGRERQPATGCDKTSVVFAFPADRPGNLYHALGEFARRDVNLTKLESRPARRALGDYVFFVDMEGHRDSPPVREALAALEEKCAFFKILGSYPRVRYERNGEGAVPPLDLRLSR